MGAADSWSKWALAFERVNLAGAHHMLVGVSLVLVVSL